MSDMTIEIALLAIDDLRSAIQDIDFKLWCRITSFRHAVEANALSSQEMHIVYAKFNTAVENHLAA